MGRGRSGSPVFWACDTGCGRLPFIAEEGIPLAQRIRDFEIGYEVEAARTSLPVDVMAKVRMLNDTRDVLPLRLATLAKLCRSPSMVGQVFTAFGGTIATFSAPTYDQPETDILRVLTRYYHAIFFSKQWAEIEACLAQEKSKTLREVLHDTLKTVMEKASPLSMGQLTLKSMTTHPDGSVRVLIRIPLTSIRNGKEATGRGTYECVMIPERDGWKVHPTGGW